MAYMYIFIIHASVDEHLAIVNRTRINMAAPVSLSQDLDFLWECTQEWYS